jgi:hypothetical protein
VPEIVIDEVKQLVRTIHLADVVLTVDDVIRYNEDVAKLVDVASKRFGRILLLVDSRTLSIQAPEVVQHFEKPDQLLRKPEDRYALVVGSTLAKLQARRVLGDDDRVCTFLSIPDAEAWLLDSRVRDEGAEEARNPA